MKKAALLCIFSLLFCLISPKTYAENLSVSAASCIVMDADTKAVLYSKNANVRRAMASTTKIMTALLCLEREEVDTVFEVDRDSIKVEGSSMGLIEGDKVSLRTLAVGMLMQSGNDAANAAAVRISKNNESFAALMNERAAKLKMENTNFVTPSGLDSEKHYSTAYDMALLGAEAIKNADFVEICSKSSYPVYLDGQKRTLHNHNRLLKQVDGCIGVKTGFTKKAGRCLVSAVRKKGRTLVCVTLNAPNDWSDHTRLYEECFSKYNVPYSETVQISVEVVSSNEREVLLLPKEECGFYIREGERVEVKSLCRPFEFAPVYRGDALGKAIYCVDGAEVFKTPLVAASSAHVKNIKTENPLNLFERFILFIKSFGGL